MINFKRIDYRLPVGIMNLPRHSYITNGGIYHQVPKGTRLEDINVIENEKDREAFWGKKTTPSFPKFEASPETVETHLVESSKGDKKYKVKVTKGADGEVKSASCTCAGFGFRGRCRHSKSFL